ncbi:D-alanyl-D-alanine carboxypeptidase family protein [Halanaerobaculum tunisiense]
MTVARLKSINNLDSNLIYPGQKLKIPEKQEGIYIVRAGDTLFEIANKYNITVDQLKLYNRLESNIINIGQKLYIPNQKLINLVNQLPNNIYTTSDSGKDVRQIQKGLNTLGYLLAEDGEYGETTRRTILNFQKQYKELANDGIYGPKTRDYLYRALLTDHIEVVNPSDILVLVNKNYSLPADYVPQNLVVPGVSFPFEEFQQKKLMREEAATALERLFTRANQENIDLYAISGYRSYDRQEAIFGAKAMERGLEVANRFSAKPGESEHQTGLAMDVSSPQVNFRLTQEFGATKEGSWLRENAPQFGFIIRYSKGKKEITGYQYEPWHIRYVGEDIASEIAKQNITLEEYLDKA